MGYRSERFDVGELAGLGQVFEAIDALEASGLAVSDEVMAGNRHRRSLHPDTITAGINVDYLLQVTFGPFRTEPETKLSARPYLRTAIEALSTMSLPGELQLDEGRFDGWDEITPDTAFGSTGYTEHDIAQLYPPWIKASWSEHGRSLLVYCGIHAPRPKPLFTNYMYDWGTRSMRRGWVVFAPTQSAPQE